MDWARPLCGSKGRALHRLDRETTGIVLFAKNARWNRQWTALFEEKRVRKSYWAAVQGRWPKGLNRVDTLIDSCGDGKWTNSLSAGKPSTTTFRLLGESEGNSCVEALPKTGRTHQIRLHCLKAGHPIVGDTLYGSSEPRPMMLHASSVRFVHPASGKSIEVEAPLPADWEPWARKIIEGENV